MRPRRSDEHLLPVDDRRLISDWNSSRGDACQLPDAVLLDLKLWGVPLEFDLLGQRRSP